MVVVVADEVRLSATGKLLERNKNAAVIGGVAGDNFGSDGRPGWSQNVGCRVRNVSELRIEGVWPATGRKVAGEG